MAEECTVKIGRLWRHLEKDMASPETLLSVILQSLIIVDV